MEEREVKRDGEGAKVERGTGRKRKAKKGERWMSTLAVGHRQKEKDREKSEREREREAQKEKEIIRGR